MKRFFIFAVIASILIIFLYFAFADLPVKYSIGQIDSRFNISQDEMTRLSEDAANRWNWALDKDVLIYDPNAPFKINLVYDQRQANLEKLRTEVSGLNLANTSISSTKEQLEDMIEEFERDLEKHNRDVAYWNNIGGAPRGTYQMLQKKKLELENRQNNLIQAIQLLNSNIQTYNRDLSSLKNELKENEGKVEAQGSYKRSEKKIDIFMFGNQNELRLVLMHEFGHALGAEHTDDPASIMYRLIGKQNFDDPMPLKEDIDAVEKGF